MDSMQMDYDALVQWMFQQIPMYQRTGKAAYKVDLEKTETIDAHFAHPHRNYKTIHVAGTNGKGSVSHMLASVFQEHGYKVGLYTSPHLKDYRERIRVNGEMISKDYVLEFIRKNQRFFEQVKPSFFEMSVALAFQYFSDQKVDVAVVEVGMGGRLDSTNVIHPEISVITNIGMDHTAFLGNTLPSIASEKAGVIKPGVPVVVGETHPATKPVFEAKANHVNAHSLDFADKTYRLIPQKIFDPMKSAFSVRDASSDKILFDLETDLLGSYQAKNLATALKAIDKLNQGSYTLERKRVLQGLTNVKQNTGFAGRWQVLGMNPMILCDTAHNEEGLRMNLAQLDQMHYQKLHFVLGFVNDKKLEGILTMFPKDAKYYFTKADIPRALDEEELQAKALASGLKGSSYSRSTDAFEAARKAAGKQDLVYVGGSTFVVSEII